MSKTWLSFSALRSIDNIWEISSSGGEGLLYRRMSGCRTPDILSVFADTLFWFCCQMHTRHEIDLPLSRYDSWFSIMNTALHFSQCNVAIHPWWQTHLRAIWVKNMSKPTFASKPSMFCVYTLASNPQLSSKRSRLWNWVGVARMARCTKNVIYLQCACHACSALYLVCQNLMGKQEK